MGRVFLLEKPRIDMREKELANLRTFGSDVKMLFEPEHKRAGLFNSTTFVEDVVNALHDVQFDPDNDCFAVVGSIVGMSLTMIGLMAFSQATSKGMRVNVLLYSAQHEKYELRAVNVSELMERIT